MDSGDVENKNNSKNNDEDNDIDRNNNNRIILIRIKMITIITIVRIETIILIANHNHNNNDNDTYINDNTYDIITESRIKLRGAREINREWTEKKRSERKKQGTDTERKKIEKNGGKQKK